MVNRIWPTAVAGEADSVSSVSALACHIGGPNSVNPSQILLVYGNALIMFYLVRSLLSFDESTFPAGIAISLAISELVWSTVQASFPDVSSFKQVVTSWV